MKTKMKKFLDNTALVLLIIGGFNWFLVWAGNFNIVAWLAGQTGSLSAYVAGALYILIGLSAVERTVSPVLK